MKQQEHWLIPIIAKQRDGSYRRGDLVSQVLRFILFCLSLVYRLLVTVRNWSYDFGLLRTNRVNAPVISVGNLTVGGTGKTPIVLWLIENLIDDQAVAVVSRGYRKLNEQLNDEGMEIARRFPTAIQIQDKNRVAAAQNALDESLLASSKKPLIVLDDGFQHRRLHRDLNLVIVDATLPFGHDHLLPRGLLREPVDSLCRADAVVLTRSNLVSRQCIDAIRERIFDHNNDIAWIEAELECDRWVPTCGATLPFEQLRSKNLLAFCGIGNPDGFKRTLRQAEMNVVTLLPYPDHHHFSADDVAELISSAKQYDCDAIVCTCKDLVKMPQAVQYEIPIFALATKTKIVSGAEEFQNLIHRLIENSNHQ